MRTMTTPDGEARRRVQELVDQLPSGGDKAFDKPWELRAFALAVAAYDNGQYDWSEFQLALISAIHEWEAGEAPPPWDYYDRWLDALETVLADAGTISLDELDRRTGEVLATPANKDHHEARFDPVIIDPAR